MGAYTRSQPYPLAVAARIVGDDAVVNLVADEVVQQAGVAVDHREVPRQRQQHEDAYTDDVEQPVALAVGAQQVEAGIANSGSIWAALGQERQAERAHISASQRRARAIAEARLDEPCTPAPGMRRGRDRW